MKFTALTNAELETVLQALDGLDAAMELLDNAGALDDDEHDLQEIADAIVEEMSSRAMEDAGYKVNQMVARGELDRYIRPDGQIGYAPPGWENWQ